MNHISAYLKTNYREELVVSFLPAGDDIPARWRAGFKGRSPLLCNMFGWGATPEAALAALELELSK